MGYNTKESGARIKKLRKRMGMTQEQLADLLNITVSNLGKIETGYSGASIDFLLEMKEVLCTTLDYIVDGGVEPTIPSCERCPNRKILKKRLQKTFVAYIDEIF